MDKSIFTGAMNIQLPHTKPTSTDGVYIKRVSLITGLLITGLDWTGLDWTGILKFAFYAQRYAKGNHIWV